MATKHERCPKCGRRARSPKNRGINIVEAVEGGLKKRCLDCGFIWKGGVWSGTNIQ